MRRPTLHRVSYLLKGCRYVLPYIGDLHRRSHRPPTMCSVMMPYYMLYNIRIIRPSFCLPSGRVSGCCPQSTGGEIWLDLREDTIRNCFCPYDSHSSEDHTVPYRDPPVWWDPQSEIPEWLQEKCLIVWPNEGVCGQEYSREDWQITEPLQSGIISILTYGIYKTYSEHGKVQYNFDSDMRDQTYTV